MRVTVDDMIDLVDWGRILGICPRDSAGVIDPRVYLALNRTSYRLLNRGDWIGSTQLVRFCLTSGCITLPRQIERVDESMLDGSPLTMRNPWWQFVDNIGTRCGNGWWGGWGPFSSWVPGSFEDRGYYATFRDVNPGSKKIRIYPDSPNDVGEEVYIQANDDDNNPIIEDPDYNGFKLTLAMPYVESSYFVSTILGVIKPITEKRLSLYEVDTANTRRLLAVYDPDETTVELRRYRAPGCCEHDEEETERTRTLLALVKIKHLPVRRPTDYLVIENPAAFEEMVRCLEKKDANDIQGAIVAEQDAVRELNLEKRNRSPKQQITVAVRTQGTAAPWKRGIGGIW